MWSFDDTQSSIAKRVLANAGYAIGKADLPSGPLDIGRQQQELSRRCNSILPIGLPTEVRAPVSGTST